MSELDLDTLSRQFMNNIIASLKMATYTVDKYNANNPNQRKPTSLEEYNIMCETAHHKICFAVTNQLVSIVDNIKFNPNYLLNIRKYFHILPDFEKDGFPITESTFYPGNVYSNFQPVSNKHSGNVMIEIIRHMFHTGEHYMSINQQSVLNQIVAIDGLYIAFYNFLKQITTPYGSPKSPLVNAKSHSLTKKNNKKAIRDPSQTKKQRYQRATHFPKWWLNVESE